MYIPSFILLSAEEKLLGTEPSFRIHLRDVTPAVTAMTRRVSNNAATIKRSLHKFPSQVFLPFITHDVMLRLK